jgi:hypothetical protein
MEVKCSDCPFASSGPGLHLRKSLARGRWREILLSLRMDGHFHCHKTTHETGDGSELLCAGSLEWQEKHIGQPGQLARVMERISR